MSENSNKNTKDTKQNEFNRKKMISSLITVGLFLLLFILIALYINYYFFGGRIRSYVSSRKPISILLIGIDDNAKSRKTDTLIIATYHPVSRRFGIISVPRDLKINFDSGLGSKIIKINSIYEKSGPKKLVSVINKLTDLDISLYASIDLSGLVKVIDILGGVDIYIPDKMTYNDQAGNLFINLPAGLLHCDGMKAVQFIRFRNDERGDMGRLDRQYEFMLNIAQKAVYKNDIFSNIKLIKVLFKYLDTNMNFNDIINLIKQAGNADINNIESIKIPGKFVNLYGVDYIEPDPSYSKKVIKDFIYKISLVKSDYLPGEIKVQVLNGSGKPGVAKIIRDKLVRNGYNVVEFGNADSQNFPQSMILNRSGNMKKSLKVSQLLKCKNIFPEINKFIMIDVTVIVGKDYSTLY